MRDVFGRPIQTLSDQEAVPGQNVQLTLVPAIQAQVESTLGGDPAQATGAKSAMAIVMDPRDGSSWRWRASRASTPTSAPT